MEDCNSLTSYEADVSKDMTVKWPLPWSIQLPKAPQDTATRTRKTFYTHTLYRGPNNEKVRILYSKTKAVSETIALQLKEEPVLGFDMEWPWQDESDRLQTKIGLIQLACQHTIALFHIGLHPGKTSEDIIAPTLRTILESPNITKCGVAIMSADGQRLVQYFGIQPKGMFELSHLHNLVTYGSQSPERVTTKIRSLAKQVEEHLGYPLSKGSVRTSNWSRPLDQRQITYAATDAYAGLMLFYRLNAKRVQMGTVLPLPLHADTYLPFRFSAIKPIRLESSSKKGYCFAEDFIPVDKKASVEADSVVSNTETSPLEKAGKPLDEVVALKKSAKKQASKSPTTTILDTDSKQLFDELCHHRRQFATNTNIPAYRIAANSTLEELAIRRPRSTDDLLSVKGIGQGKCDQYGAEWLEIIAKFETVMQRAQEQSTTGVSFQTAMVTLDTEPAQNEPVTNQKPGKRPHTPLAQCDVPPSSSPGFETPLGPAQLKTGLSFQMANSSLAPKLEQVMHDQIIDLTSSPELQAKSPSHYGFDNKDKPIERRALQSRNSPLSRPKATISPRSRKFQGALNGIVNRIATILRRKTSSILSETSTSLLVASSPRTVKALQDVPGTTAFVTACEEAKIDLEKFLRRHCPPPR